MILDFKLEVNVNRSGTEQRISNAVFTTLAAYNVPISTVTRFLHNCSSPHAMQLFNTNLLIQPKEHSENIMFEVNINRDQPIDSRSRYPLTVVTMLNNTANTSQPHQRVRGVLSVYHIKNVSNTRKSALLLQSLLCAENQHYPLKKVYLGQELCIVCQVEKSSVCLLPCGHMCVCDSCCFLIRLKCPLCRTAVTNTILNYSHNDDIPQTSNVQSV